MVFIRPTEVSLRPRNLESLPEMGATCHDVQNIRLRTSKSAKLPWFPHAPHYLPGGILQLPERSLELRGQRRCGLVSLPLRLSSESDVVGLQLDASRGYPEGTLVAFEISTTKALIHQRRLTGQWANTSHLMDHATQERGALLWSQLRERSAENELRDHQLVTRVDFTGNAALQLNDSFRITVPESPQHTFSSPHLDTKADENLKWGRPSTVLEADQKAI